jgi:hypothetical protein
MLKEIYDTAQWILSGGLPMLPSTTSTVPVSKSEPIDTQSIIQAMMMALVPAITQSMAQSITPLIQQLSSLNQSTNANTTRAFLCLFCGLIDHRLGNCPKVKDYINVGKCKHINGKIQLPDGMELGRDLPGFNFQQKINNWFTSNPNTKVVPISEQNCTAHPCATMGLWKISEPSMSQYHWAEQARIEEVPTEDEDTNALESSVKAQEDDAILVAAQAIIEKRTMHSALKNIRFDSPPAHPFTGNPANHSTSTSPSAPSSSDKTDKPLSGSQALLSASSTATPQKVTPPSPLPTSSSSTAPQFSFKTPIEDSSHAQELYSMILNTPIPGITPRHILAASADVRKLVKEDTTTKKVPTALVGTVTTDPGITHVAEAFPQKFDVSAYTARRLESLRSINLVINDDFSAECILDLGCQIVVIRKDVWERTKLPLLGMESMTMEAANPTTSNTLGLVKNLKVSVGDFLYFLLVQVVEKAGFEVLLGHPFTVIAQALTKDFSDGDQHITIFELVTKAQQTIPTFDRTRRLSPHVGF